LGKTHKYILDLSDLQFKRVRIHWKVRFLRSFGLFALSVLVAVFYWTIFEKVFGTPEEKILNQQVDNIKLKYSLLGREMDNSLVSLSWFKLSDDKRYRPILNMDTLSESYRKGGFGGVDRYGELKGYSNSDLIISYRNRLEEIKSIANVQRESFRALSETAENWKKEMDHLPIISPVDVKYKLGDGFRMREKHPVLGTPQMHYGQDFEVPYGTNVYATGDGTVIQSGWNGGGYGNCIVIDHGHGLQSTYGHLSDIRVPVGMNVKRGDLIGLSGSTGLSSGPHLHYQIEQFGQHKNAFNFFNNDITEEEYNEMIQTLGSRTKPR
jgi:murein DD-endopeptidase MepM/ murein hydrolase activator NlpD